MTHTLLTEPTLVSNKSVRSLWLDSIASQNTEQSPNSNKSQKHNQNQITLISKSQIQNKSLTQAQKHNHSALTLNQQLNS